MLKAGSKEMGLGGHTSYKYLKGPIMKKKERYPSHVFGKYVAFTVLILRYLDIALKCCIGLQLKRV